MRYIDIITENYETISINGILYSLTKDEKDLYNKIKNSSDIVYKKNLDEYTQRIASNMVSKGILNRRKDKKHQIYFKTRGRNKNICKSNFNCTLPPDISLQKWVSKNEQKYEQKYGKDYKKYLYKNAWNKFNGKPLNENYEYLIEGIEDVKKYFPKIPSDKFNELIALDPTYTGGDELGTYGKWILGLYNNFMKDKIAYEKWEEQKRNGMDYPPPAKKSQEQAEDFEKLPNLLLDFDNIKQKAKLNINNIKSIAQLYQAIESVKSQGISTNKKVQRGIELFKKSVEKGGKVVFKDNKWAVLVPETFESSKVFGEDTNWCTTASSGNYYNYYLKKYGGKYFINLDLETGDLYQFHFESEQFMDSSDNPIILVDYVRKFPSKLKEYYYNNIIQENVSSNGRLPEDLEKYKYLFKDKLDKNDENDILSFDQFNNIIPYIQHPTPKIEEFSLSYDIRNVKYLENINDKIINMIMKNEYSVIPIIMNKISDDKLLELILKEIRLFSLCYKQDARRFNNKLFEDIIKNVAKNIDNIGLIDDVKLSLDKLEILAKYFFDIKKPNKNNIMNINNFFSYYNIDDLPSNLRYVYIVSLPFKINGCSNITETDIQALIDTINYNYNRVDINLVDFSNSIENLSSSVIQKIMELLELSYQKNLNIQYDSIIKFFSFEQNKHIMELDSKMISVIFSLKISTEESKKYVEYIMSNYYKEISDKSISNFIGKNIVNDICSYCLPIINQYNSTIQYDLIELLVSYLPHIKYNNTIFRIINLLYKYCNEIPYALQNKLLSVNINYGIAIKNMDERLQNKLINKNPFNIKFINNPTENIIKKAYELNPETENYIR